MQKDELLTKMRQGYAEFTAYLGTLTPEQHSLHTDAVGWTIKDHVMHAVVWEDSVWALLTGRSRAEVMVVDAGLFDPLNVDGINAAVQEQTKDIPFDEVLRRLDAVHTRLLAHVESINETDINAPLVTYLPTASERYRQEPFYLYIAGNTYEHYEEHLPWLEAIARGDSADDDPTDKADLLSRMREGYDDFVAFVTPLDLTRVTIATDAAGWTIKDHVIHLAVWEDGVAALLNKGPRVATMGVDQAIWDRHELDEINAAIQQNNRYLSWGEVLRRFEAAHGRMMAALERLSWEDLHRPYGNFLPDDQADNEGRPILDYVMGDGYLHYAEHRPWIEAIQMTDPIDSVDTLLTYADKAWDYLRGYCESLTEAEATGATDAAGWTAKDHEMHLAVWTGGVTALLNKQDRTAAMGIDPAAWAAREYDLMNEQIRQRTHAVPWAEVKQHMAEAHQGLIAKARSLTWADLQKPYGAYMPAGQENSDGDPVFTRIAANTFWHYPEHIEWADTIIYSS